MTGNAIRLMSDWRAVPGANAISLRALARVYSRIICERQKRTAKKDKPKSKVEAMRSHVRELHRRLRTYRARQWEIEVDGSDLSGRYLLWHAMNIRSVGPVLTLTADAKTSDGTFDFVGAREEDRALLLDYFDARVGGKRRKFPLRAKRFTKMRLHWNKWPLHFDDELWPSKDERPPKQCKIQFMVKDSALRIWKPR